MEALFLKTVNMSIAAGWLVIAVIILRLLLKKAPKSAAVMMWALVGVRLICPISFESPLSLIPSAQTIPDNFTSSDAPAVQSGIYAVNSAVNPVISSALSPDPGESANPAQIMVSVLALVWIAGMAVMLFYTAASAVSIQRKVRESIPYKGNIRLCDHIATPFIFGVFRPVIYLPSDISTQDVIYVTAHEKAHLKRRDHWWKPLGFLLLAIYWFNPLLWAAYILFCRDIEFACDEKVLKEMGAGIKKPYSRALISCSAPRSSLAACPLAFGEAGVKARIKSVLNYRKPGFWIVTAAVAACIVLAVCFLTSPPSGSFSDGAASDTELSAYLENVILEHHRSDYSENNFCCTDFDILGTDGSADRITVYMWVMYGEYRYDSSSGLQQESGAYIPTAVTVRKDGGNFELEEYWEPRDGSYYVGDIQDKFPRRLWPAALNQPETGAGQEAACEQKALEYFENGGGGSDGAAQPAETGRQITYRYFSEYDSAAIVLSPSDRTFSFTFSLLSSYLPHGTYETDGDRIILYTDDRENHYTFRRDGENLIFISGESSAIPRYRYSSDSQETTVSVPDGAVFEPNLSGS